MNTLREIGEFVGLGNATPQQPGKPVRAQITMRSVGANVPVLSSSERTSMRAMILGLQNLPPISLEAEVEETVGEVPFAPSVHVHPSNGVILETRVAVFQNGRLFAEDGRSMGASGGLNAFLTLDIPGSYLLEVRRTGIPNTGITTLRKAFDIIVKAKPTPTPTPKEPTISATTESAGAGTILVVTGVGFLPNKTVTVRVVDDVFHERNFQQSSTTAGELRMRIPLPCNSGLPFHVSATDSRPAPGILGVLFSNNVTLSCP
ncbi:MAG: hypothetical protein QOF89_3173 [Acidobacteriota bacterium]|jgi:hypothetical protein|nr:hypothetical protein [Acidobacteriota bacterium]